MRGAFRLWLGNSKGGGRERERETEKCEDFRIHGIIILK